ncbi:uncharacterized protein [Asterias amurensis]|uniref:uncharacterized protein n=1 Tax=Asterias amurensis TaxID=7602 RepID=UPI003AB45139
MAGFLVKDTLTVLTQNGECHIQLCLGDITKLQHKDKVDVILISAFQHDYTPSQTSVIGALLRNLKINVRDLARDKEEDLRQLYHCWWSKPLPEDKPYQRLLCFETRVFGSRRPQELVGDVFRCLVPKLNNQDSTVITPLLNTGDQGHGREVMLKGMVEAAVNWMKAGLPLRKLMIVLYCHGDDDAALEASGAKQFSHAFKQFADLKDQYMMKDLTPKDVTINFDVYLSVSKLDTELASVIKDKLHLKKSDIRIFDSNQKMICEEVWQEDMYDVMMHSARVITVLTPNYLQCTSCVEQYNIALCCSRNANRNMLAPFYIKESSLPTYMTQVQYVDCRTSSVDRIGDACHQIVLSLSVTLKAKPLMDPTIQYDIFISYSHCDSERANHIVKYLKALNPDLRLFFDIQELKTGSAWQRTLYHSIDGSRVMLALISNKYLSSAVCQEEYNLALAKHCSESSTLKLIPLCIEDIFGVTPPEFTKVKMVNAKGDSFLQAADTTCSAVDDWLAGKEVDSDMKALFDKTEDLIVDVDTVLESTRRLRFQEKYGDKENLIKKELKFPTHLPDSLPNSPEIASDNLDAASNCDVAFSYANEDKKYAIYLAEMLGRVSGLVVNAHPSSDLERLSLIDQAKYIVVILSPHYIDSLEKCEEFNIALSRQRMISRRILFPVQVHVLPQQPTYFRLVPSDFNSADKMWPELCNSHKKTIGPTLDVLESHNVDIAEPTKFAFHVAALTILEEIKKQRLNPDSTVKQSSTLRNIMNIKGQLDNAFKDSSTVPDNAVHNESESLEDGQKRNNQRRGRSSCLVQ